MGGRAEDDGGVMEKFIGVGYRDPVTGDVVMLPGMYRVVDDRLPVDVNRISNTDAVSQMQEGFKGTGVNLTQQETTNVMHTLLAAGAIAGKGDIRTRLYRAARMIGNYEALTKGHKAIVRRYMRILTGRITGQTFRKLFN